MVDDMPRTVKGTVTALATPFDASHAVDYGALRALVERQIAGGVEGICSVGTSGESPTLTHAEHMAVIEKTVEFSAGRVAIVAGTGSNSTDEAVALTRAAISIGGVDATLQVTPYYNKPSDEGMYRHFMTIADLGLNVVLYNVPSRTGRALSIELIKRLASHPGIVAVKEAGGDVERVSAIKEAAPRLAVLSGDDALALEMARQGASGVVSVASNIIPREMGDMMRLAAAGDFSAAGEIDRKYSALFRDLFIDTNPVMVKEALAMMGLAELSFRLPLCETAPEKREAMRRTLHSLGLVR